MSARITVTQVWLIWAALLAAALLVVAWPAGAPPVQPASSPAEPGQGLPSLSPVPLPLPGPAARPGQAEVERWGQVLANSTLWGARARPVVDTAAQAETPEPLWALTGVYRVGGQFAAVLSWEGLARPSQQVRRGDLLPDRSRVLAIEHDRVQVRGPSRRDPPRWLTVNRGLAANESPQDAQAQRP